MRRLHLPTVVAGAVAAVALTAGPAWAAPSFVSGGEAEAGDDSHDVTMQVPDAEGAGATTEVLLTAPDGFVPASCIGPVGWSCVVEGRRVRWTAGGGLPQVGTFGFRTAVPTTPGTYSFPVRQTGTEDTVTWTAGNGAPAMTVTGEQAPAEDGDDEPSAEPEDAPSEQEEPTTAPSPQASSGPAPAATPADEGGDGDDATDGDDGLDGDTSDGDGSTAPTRTRGRSGGTTLEVAPDDRGAEAGAAAPSVAAPDVAGATAAAPAPDAAATTAAGADLGDDRWPWQQVLGAALLVLAVVITGALHLRRR